MKKLTTLFLLIIFRFTLLGQTESEIIKKANDFIDNKKYESAFKLLENFDPSNAKPDIVLLKEHIAINYFVTSLMHQMFAFKDLEKNEQIMDYRGQVGSFGMYSFPANEILDSLIKIYPTNYNLFKGLGDFYYDAQQRYEGNWLKDGDTLANLIITNYQVVIDHHQADYFVYYKVGFELLNQEKIKEAIPYLLESIKLKSDFADANYNVAYAYLFNDDRENCLKYAKYALDLYKGKNYKGDAARMIAQVYTEQKDDKNAIKYYELANSIDPHNYYNLKPLLAIYVKTGNKNAKDILNKFFNLAPENPTIYNDLKGIYIGEKNVNKLIEFYKSKLPEYNSNKKVLGNLNFYIGQLYLNLDKKTAKDYFLKAKDIFITIYDKNHGVFQAIEDGLKETE